MHNIDTGINYGKSIFDKNDKKVERIKKINNHMTIIHYLTQQNSKLNSPISELNNILKNK